MQDFRYKISLGQNFLFDADLLNRLIDQAGLGQQDTVLEVGAGRGDLTEVLAERCGRVTAIEIDSRLEAVLNDRFAHRGNVRIVMGDAMELDLAELMAGQGGFHVVANLPYYLTTPILTLLLRADLPLQGIHVMVQKEAALRVLAQPGTPEYGPLAILAAYRGEPRATINVPARMFTPPPKVDSVFLVIPLHSQAPVQVDDKALLFRVVSAAFAMRRKTLANNLMGAFSLTRQQAMACIQDAGLPEQVRGERLNLEEFARLTQSLGRLHKNPN